MPLPPVAILVHLHGLCIGFPLCSHPNLCQLPAPCTKALRVWPERLSSTNMGSQVRGLNLKETEDGSGDKARSTDPQPI